ncbi:MAG: lipoyl(octanoyl) transferase [Cytophagaceae bacterium SCN 52-12]|nr:MAG: lipoyl(octanoyl) transferase [Cytophagaceae bacterium SCN 52-12]
MELHQNKRVYFRDLGLLDYKEAWDYQEKIFSEIVDRKVNNRKLEPEKQTPTDNYLIFCQHPHVYTLGKSGKEDHLLLDDHARDEKKVAYYRINRGGDITYHGPGQLVGYPILDLDHFFTDIHRYIRTLEEAVIRVLAGYGLNAGRIEGLTGVWLGHDGSGPPRKICAIGVKTSRWVTMHGFALNVSPDLAYFGHIIPCGISDKAVTSMQLELAGKIDMQEVSDSLASHLAGLFGMELVTDNIYS